MDTDTENDQDSDVANSQVSDSEADRHSFLDQLVTQERPSADIIEELEEDSEERFVLPESQQQLKKHEEEEVGKHEDDEDDDEEEEDDDDQNKVQVSKCTRNPQSEDNCKVPWIALQPSIFHLYIHSFIHSFICSFIS